MHKTNESAARFRRFGNMFPPEEVMERSYLMAEKPFRIYGNLYFVGNTWCSSHLIDTGDGLILLDTPCLNELSLLIHSITELGFRLSDLKYIVISHAHPDHYGAVRALVHLTGAKTFLGRIDAEDMVKNRERLAHMHRKGTRLDEGFTPDVLLDDGDVIRLGNTEMRCVLTPGHTVGCMSHFWTAYDGEEQKQVGIYGGAGFVSLQEGFIKKMGLPADIRETFAASIDKVWDENVDITLGNHPFHNDTFDKHEKQQAEGGNPFVDPAEWQRFLTELRSEYRAFLSMTREEIDAMYGESGFLAYRDIVTPHLLGDNR